MAARDANGRFTPKPTTREQAVEQAITVVLDGLDANLSTVVRMRREFGPSADDASVMRLFVEHAADAIGRQMRLLSR